MNIKALTLAVAASGLVASAVQAGQIIGQPTGLASPAETITFDEIVLSTDTVVTNQYAGYGVTFSPNVYYSPQSFSAIGVDSSNVGNFSFPTEPSFINPVTLSFSATQSAVAFGMAADDTPYLFTAELDGTTVDSFAATVSNGRFYGFTGENFNSIVISQAGGRWRPILVARHH